MKEANSTNLYSQTTQRLVPVVNFNKCEAKGICTHVCLQNVFRIQQITNEQFGQLSFIGKVKTLFSDNRKAFVTHPEHCLACGLCVEACSEGAIRLVSMPDKAN